MQPRSILTLAVLSLCAAAPVDSNKAPAPAAQPPVLTPSDSASATPRNLQDFLNEYTDLYNSTHPSDQIKLAQMLWRASANAESSSQQFAMLSASRDAAARGGDFNSAWQVCDIAVDKFNVSPSALRVGIFKSGVDALNRSELTEPYFAMLLKAVDQALRADDFDSTSQMLKTAKMAPVSTTRWDNALEARQTQLAAQMKVFPAVKASLEVLKKDAQNSHANTVVGEYTCLIKNDWKSGRVLLTRGDDKAMRQVAVQDVQDPTKTEDQISVADGWAQLAGTHPGFARQFAVRSYDWYLKALPLATLADQRKHVDEALVALVPTVEADRPHAAMWIAVGDALNNRTYTPSRVAGGDNATDSFDENFQDLPANGGLLVGFHYAQAILSKHTVITYLQPIYQTATGEVDGASYGHAYSPVQTVLAPQGYAVGAIRAFGDATVNSITITWMRIDKDRLNSEEVQYSGRMGGSGGTLEILDGHGTPVMGICGRQKDGFIGLGLMYSQPVKEQ